MTEETKTRTESRTEIQKKVTKKRATTKVAPKVEEKSSAFVYYVTAKPEPVPFTMKIAGVNYKGVFDSDKEFIAFRIPKDVAHRMDMHDFVVKGRLVKAEG